MFFGMSMQRAIVGRVVAMRNPSDIFCGDEPCAICCRSVLFTEVYKTEP